MTRAKMFSAPHTPDEPVSTQGKDIRGFTVTTYNFWAGICEAAVVDHEIAVDADGYYTLVVSKKEDRPANATPENGVTWLDWGDYLDGQLTYRLLLRRSETLTKLRKAVEEGEADPSIAAYVPRSKHVSRAEFEARGWRAAFDE